MEGDILRIPPVRTSQEKEHFVGDRLEQLLKKSIIYEDNELLVINKPAGIAVHGGSGLSLGVIEALRKIRTDLHYLELVHRLDRDTSGCLLLAKKRSALRLIQAQLESREVKKIYWALLHNTWTDNRKILVDQPLKKIFCTLVSAWSLFILKENLRRLNLGCWRIMRMPAGWKHLPEQAVRIKYGCTVRISSTPLPAMKSMAVRVYLMILFVIVLGYICMRGQFNLI